MKKRIDTMTHNFYGQNNFCGKNIGHRPHELDSVDFCPGFIGKNSTGEHIDILLSGYSWEIGQKSEASYYSWQE